MRKTFMRTDAQFSVCLLETEKVSQRAIGYLPAAALGRLNSGV